MEYWITTESTGHYFFYAFPVCILLLFVFFKGRRISFLIPSLFISIIIVNPLFFDWWNNLGLYAYWRVLWSIPVIPGVAVLIPVLTETIGTNNWDMKKAWVAGISKIIITAMGIMGIVLGGSFVYNSVRGQFELSAVNSSKIPPYIVEIADRLLKLDKYPRIIAQDPIGVYIRQYTGAIDTLFGRDINKYIISPSSTAEWVNNDIKNQDSSLSRISQLMLDDGYDFLVMTERKNHEGLELLETVSGYGIYKAIGIPRVKKERNELGQIVSVTTINEFGQPQNSIHGYSTINYKYDSSNNMIYEFRQDENGVGVADTNGVAGYEYIFDESQHVILARILGNDSNPIIGPLGYSEVRRVYQGNSILSESYFDTESSLATNSYGFSSFETKYDNDGNLVERVFYNKDQIVECVEGYSKIVWDINDEGTTNVHFLDLEGNELSKKGINLANNIAYGPDGWSEWLAPVYNKKNSSIYIGEANLGQKEKGDIFICQIEIEFRNVKCTDDKEFLFWTQGPVDGNWDSYNIWNPELVNLVNAPDDGVYQFTSKVGLYGPAVNASNFMIGFRCDNWEYGEFRVRNVAVVSDE